jgi:multidrug efflux pump subunit AcrA (membrane-fusion protein)
VTLKFIAKDDRIRSGMTANLDILTQEKQDVLAIPSRTIISENNQKFVNIINAGDNALPIKTEIRTGIRGIDGYVEILSGLKDGDLVVTNN